MCKAAVIFTVLWIFMDEIQSFKQDSNNVKRILCIDQHKPAWFERDFCVRCASYSILLHLTTDNWPFFSPTKYLAEISLMWHILTLSKYIRLVWRKWLTAIQHLPMFCTSSFHSFAFYLDGMNINTSRFIFLLLKIWIAETFE